MLCELLGFCQGRPSPCVFFHPQRNMRLTVHGDDFAIPGPMKHLHWLAEQLAKSWIVEIKGILGPPGTEGTSQDIRYLNRILTWDQDGLQWEPEPRHVDRPGVGTLWR